LSEGGRPLKPVPELDAAETKKKHASNLKRMGDRCSVWLARIWIVISLHSCNALISKGLRRSWLAFELPFCRRAFLEERL